jgi:hypothetical protein
LVSIQLIWLLDLGLRVGNSPHPLAVGATIAVLGVAISVLRAQRRTMS